MGGCWRHGGIKGVRGGGSMAERGRKDVGVATDSGSFSGNGPRPSERSEESGRLAGEVFLDRRLARKEG